VSHKWNVRFAGNSVKGKNAAAIRSMGFQFSLGPPRPSGATAMMGFQTRYGHPIPLAAAVAAALAIALAAAVAVSGAVAIAMTASVTITASVATVSMAVPAVAVAAVSMALAALARGADARGAAERVEALASIFVMAVFLAILVVLHIGAAGGKAEQDQPRNGELFHWYLLGMIDYYGRLVGW
jgi:hypothetical protein